jgi:hypothetical protein
MVWLFGQIWLWLIVAFALGALSAWRVLRTGRRPPEPAAAEPPAEPRYAAEEPPLLATEQTQFIPYVGPGPGRAVDDDPDAPEPVGHHEGHLPLPPQRGPHAADWPAADEPAWPQADDQLDVPPPGPPATPPGNRPGDPSGAAHRWPPAPHQPGRGG